MALGMTMIDAKDETRHGNGAIESFLPLKARPSFAPRVKNALQLSRSAEGEIKHACRLVSLRSEAAGLSSLG